VAKLLNLRKGESQMVQVQSKDYAGKADDLTVNMQRAMVDLRVQKQIKALEDRIATLEAKLITNAVAK